MGRFNDALQAFLATVEQRASWDRHIPEVLCAEIHTREDFVDFLAFVNEYAGTNHLEYGCEDTSVFLKRLQQRYANLSGSLDRAREQGINSEYGLLAYLIIFAMGN